MSALLDPGHTFADYVIEAVIGRGGMSVVYRARELHPDRTVALKLLDPELAEDEAFRQRFLRESDMAASIGHPNIVPIFDAGEVDGQLFIAMPLIGGSDLGALIRNEGALDAHRAVAIVAQVGRGLDAGHAQGLIHRDVKPANILLVPGSEPGEPEHVYLADFGLAKRSTTSLRLTQASTFLGTREYAAPEQIRGEEVDGRADIYALGCVLYECLSGTPPFDADSETALIYAHLEREPPRISEVRPNLPQELDAVISRAMAKLPDDRYSSCRSLTAEARAAVAGRAPQTLVEDGVTEVDVPAAPRLAAATSREARGARRPAARGISPRLLGGLGVAAAAAVVIVLAVSGGGGGDTGTSTPSSLATTSSTTTSTGQTTTKPTPIGAASPAVTAYRKRVLSVNDRIAAVNHNFPDASDFGNPPFANVALSDAARMRSVADGLDALDPPRVVLPEHESLVARLHGVETDFRALATASDNNDATAASKALNTTVTKLDQITSSVKRILRTLNSS